MAAVFFNTALVFSTHASICWFQAQISNFGVFLP